MPQQLGTYSGKDLNFSLSSQVTGTIQAAGIQTTGVKQLTIRMTVDQTLMETGMDGSVAVSAIPGDYGEIEIQVWQTSPLQAQLLTWYDALVSARNTGDVSNWATSTVLIKNIVDGSQHTCSGVCPTKFPDKQYGTQAVTCNWVLKSAQITNS